jgi:hypothetical protein
LLEQRPQAESDDLVVVDQHQPDFWLCRHRRYRVLPSFTTIRVP